MDDAHEWLCGNLREADFHGGEGAGVVGADRVGGRLARVAVEAAGDVDGELLARLGVHPVDGGVEWRARLARGAGAEHRVDEPVSGGGVLVEVESRPAEPRRTLCRSARGTYWGRPGSLCDVEDWKVSFLKDREVGGGIAAQFAYCGEQNHVALVAADREMPGDDEAVAGVITFAAEDDDRAGDAEALQDIDGGAARVFHEHEAAHAVVVDRMAVERLGLIARQHGCVHAVSV